MTNIGAPASDAWATAIARCPKRMSHGPCAGVGADLGCEVRGIGRCSYLDVPDADWPYPPVPAPASAPAARPVRPMIVADLPAPALDAEGLRECAKELAGSVDAALIGEPPGHAPLCSVAHAPAAPPARKRLPRVLAKISAGADAVFIDHRGGPRSVASAVTALRGAGFTGMVLACVPVVTSAAAAELNLSGGTRLGEHRQFARAMARIGQALREGRRRQ